MTKINIQESKTGTFLIRKRQEVDTNLSNLFDKLKIDLTHQTREFVDILITFNDQIFYFDYDDFKDTFKCPFFEFQFLIKAWMNNVNIPNDKWVRVDIFIR